MLPVSTWKQLEMEDPGWGDEEEEERLVLRSGGGEEGGRGVKSRGVQGQLSLVTPLQAAAAISAYPSQTCFFFLALADKKPPGKVLRSGL